MKHTLHVCRDLFAKTCILFTVIFITFFTIGIKSGVPGWAFGLDKTYMILLFSALLSICGLIFHIPNLSTVWACLLHFAATGFSSYCIFVLWLGYAKNAGMTLVVLFLFILAYALWLTAFLLLRGKNKRKAAAPYEPQFRKKGR